MTIDELIEAAHETAVEKGWWPDGAAPTVIPEKIALMHSELSEALEEFRNGWSLGTIRYDPADEPPRKPEGFVVELADEFIRIADLVGAFELGAVFEDALRLKLAYNRTRPHRHGDKRA